MAAAIGLRGDYDARSLRAIAKRSKDGAQARRLLALASIYDGGARSEAAKIGGVTLQVVEGPRRRRVEEQDQRAFAGEVLFGVQV